MQEELKSLFRQNELQARQQRRDYLLRCFENEIKLMGENIAELDRAACNKAIEQLKEANLAFEKLTRPGYWQRLWAAIWGR